MNFFLPSVCFGLVFLIMVFGDGLVVAVAKLLLTVLVIVGVQIVGHFRRAKENIHN